MYTIFDTETSGLKDDSRIAQFAAILYDDQRVIRGEINILIRPDGWVMPEETAAFHGITQARLEKYGVSIEGALAIFNRWCGMSEYLVAHNAPYDIGRMRHEAKIKNFALAMPHKTFCTQRESCDIVKMPPTEKMIAKGMGRMFKNPKLVEAYQHFFGETFQGQHDAMADLRACARVFFHLLDLKTQGENANGAQANS